MKWERRDKKQNRRNGRPIGRHVVKGKIFHRTQLSEKEERRRKRNERLNVKGVIKAYRGRKYEGRYGKG